MQRSADDQTAVEDANRDVERIKSELDSLVYTEGVEEAVIEILRNASQRGSMAQTVAYLNWIFDGLQSPKKGLFGDTTYYDAMFDRFDRVNEIRTYRDIATRYKGRESAKEAERRKAEAAEREETDQGGDWQENTAETYYLPETPENLAKANLIVRRLSMIPSSRLTPEARAASELIAREGPKGLLRKHHFVTESERIERRKAAAREMARPFLEILLWVTVEQIAVIAIEAIAARLFAGAAEAAAGGLAGGGVLEGGIASEGRLIVGEGYEARITALEPMSGEVAVAGRSQATGESISISLNVDSGAGVVTRANGEALAVREGQLAAKGTEAGAGEAAAQTGETAGRAGRGAEAGEAATGGAAEEGFVLESELEAQQGMRVIEHRPPGGRVELILDETCPPPNDVTGQRLLRHVERAIEMYEEQGLTANQIADIRTLERANRMVEARTAQARYRGDKINEIFRELVANDAELEHVYVTARGERGIDVFDAKNHVQYDLTTRQAWGQHVRDYNIQGPEMTGPYRMYRLPTEVR
ncbi:MAG: hypothetical protein JNM70_02955 [Anaerolineae bacterium]|nr:hypothetical protein [Anaerolineae bacterium]